MNRIANSKPMFTFTGRDCDKELQATPNRRFDPAVGRWLEADHVGYHQSDANQYRYPVNRPE